MPRASPLTFATLVGVSEVRAARAAVREVLACVCSGRARRARNPLVLHGPSGSGKTHLVSALAAEAARRNPQLVINWLPAGEREQLGRLWDDEGGDALAAFRECDLLIVEDLQHLAPRHARPLTFLFDDLLSRQVQMVFTAQVGPAGLELPARLTSRLAAGLVVGLEPPTARGRRAILADKAERKQLAVRPAVLDWLAKNCTGGGRQLEGALARLEVLGRGRREPPEVAVVVEHFREEGDTARPTVARIAQQVSRQFHVDARSLRSDRRGREVVLPRHVGMYLARQLTGLSLVQIGDYFGGRDHSTVLHACRKVEQALADNAVLAGTVKQLVSELT